MNIFTIPSGFSFVDALAQGVLREYALPDTPEILSNVTILLPNRRGCRALHNAFLQQSEGKPLLLPRISPIGDIDEDALLLGQTVEERVGEGEKITQNLMALPPALSTLRRQILLTQTILAAAPGLMQINTEAESQHGHLSITQASALAEALANLLDQVQIARLDWSRLHEIVPETLAVHWGNIVEFLKIITQIWPDILAAESCLDPIDRRNRLLSAWAMQWRQSPPTQPVIVAGTTGSIPAVRDLIAVITGLPNGFLVLPGLDQTSSQADWAEIRKIPNHPQYGMIELLDQLERSVDCVQLWPATGLATPETVVETRQRQARQRLIAEVMRPAETSDIWSASSIDRESSDIKPSKSFLSDQEQSMAARLYIEKIDTMALVGLTRIDAQGPQEEAAVIAFLLREALEQNTDSSNGITAALATRDRKLARRVAVLLRRWDIEIDDSAGLPLIETVSGSFVMLLAEATMQALAPVPLLALLKHPLAMGGLERVDFLDLVRQLDRLVLRGARPEPFLSGLHRALCKRVEETKPVFAPLVDFITRLGVVLEPLLVLAMKKSVPVLTLVTAHIRAAEALAASPSRSGAECLWSGHAGAATAEFLYDLHSSLENSKDGFAIAPVDYPEFIQNLMNHQTVRPVYGQHRQLAIWGPLEARLQQPDLLIFGGLNEGSWPGEPPADPWMSRLMRHQFGLPPHERRIGLAAHDFAQGACCRKIILTRAARSEGAPTIASRWLMRLNMVCDASPHLDRQKLFDAISLRRAQQLDYRVEYPQTLAIRRPAPCPPIAARPRRFSVTQIEMLIRDPYAFYARHILHLKKLDEIDANINPADRGILIHGILEQLVYCPAMDVETLYKNLERMGEKSFASLPDNPLIKAFWWPRFLRVAWWIANKEVECRLDLTARYAEIQGIWSFEAPAGPITLFGRADRINLLRDGSLEIIDYKTGALSSVNDVVMGIAPQLALEGVIAEFGGFEKIGKMPVSALRYWQVSGGRIAGKIRDAGGTQHSARELIEQAENAVRALAFQYDSPDYPYRCLADQPMAPDYNDYTHLARVAEWSEKSMAEE